MWLVCYRFCLEAVTALQVTSINLKQKEGTRKHTLAKHLIIGSDLVSFLKERKLFRGWYLCCHFGASFFCLVMRVFRHHNIKGAGTFEFDPSLFKRNWN
jgi:hypothetical protein